MKFRNWNINKYENQQTSGRRIEKSDDFGSIFDF